MSLNAVAKFQVSGTPALSWEVKCAAWVEIPKLPPVFRGKGTKKGPWLLRITNRKSQAADRSVSVPLTWSDL